jgi:hypothetical protein
MARRARRTVPAALRTLALLAAQSVVALVIGCGDDGDLSPGRPAFVALEAAPDTVLLPAIEATIAMTVTATTAAGSAIDVTADARTAYASRDAGVAGAGGGRVSAAGEGVTTIVVTAEQLVDSIVVRVDPAAPAAIDSFAVSPAGVTLLPDNTASLRARIVWANGAALAAAGSPFTFRSSDEAVARVSAAGVVTALRVGRCTITVGLGESRATVPVIVAPVFPISFAAQVLPILQQRCSAIACHPGDTLFAAQRDLRLASYDGLMRGGTNGPVVVPGDATASRLVAALRGTLPSTLRMPLGGTLDEASIVTIESWIEQGACRTASECPPQEGMR